MSSIMKRSGKFGRMESTKLSLRNRSFTSMTQLLLSSGGSGGGSSENSLSVDDTIIKEDVWPKEIVIIQGLIRKKGPRGGLLENWKMRYFVVYQSRIEYFLSKEAYNNISIKPKGIIPFSKVSKVQVPSDNFGFMKKEGFWGFCIVTPDRRYSLFAENKDIRHHWVKTLRKILGGEITFIREKVSCQFRSPFEVHCCVEACLYKPTSKEIPDHSKWHKSCGGYLVFVINQQADLAQFHIFDELCQTLFSTDVGDMIYVRVKPNFHVFDRNTNAFRFRHVEDADAVYRLVTKYLQKRTVRDLSKSTILSGRFRDIETYLENLNLEKYIGIFAREGIDLTKLAILSESEMNELGISLEDQKKLKSSSKTYIGTGRLSGLIPREGRSHSNSKEKLLTTRSLSHSTVPSVNEKIRKEISDDEIEFMKEGKKDKSLEPQLSFSFCTEKCVDGYSSLSELIPYDQPRKGNEIEKINKTKEKEDESQIKRTQLQQSDETISSISYRYKEINYDDLKLAPIPIGKGAFGVVWLGQWRGAKVAVKELLCSLENPDQIRDFKREAGLMGRLSWHPNIVRFIGLCSTPPNFCLVTEYYEKGSVYDLLIKRKEDPGWTRLVEFARGAAAGILHLHHENCIHRDIAARNILVDDNWNVRITDFGLSRIKQSTYGITRSNVGNVSWMAPEAINDRGYSRKTDVYSFGIYLWELVSRDVPYKEKEAIDIAMGVVHDNIRPDIPKSCPKEFSDLMKWCWDKLPDSRPTMDEVLNKLVKYQEELTILV